MGGPPRGGAPASGVVRGFFPAVKRAARAATTKRISRTRGHRRAVDMISFPGGPFRSRSVVAGRRSTRGDSGLLIALPPETTRLSVRTRGIFRRSLPMPKKISTLSRASLALLLACVAGFPLRAQAPPASPPVLGPVEAVTTPPHPCTVPGIKEEVRCATYAVWENREAKKGRKIGINVVILP